MGPGRQSGGQTLTEHSDNDLGPDAGEQTGQVQGPKTYVDRVVQEILDTERTYVQDLRSIVEVRSLSINDMAALQKEEVILTHHKRVHIKSFHFWGSY